MKENENEFMTQHISRSQKEEVLQLEGILQLEGVLHLDGALQLEGVLQLEAVLQLRGIRYLSYDANLLNSVLHLITMQ